jgi:catechol 2,3-dioxygenase-like lactoylglutathione lyase family enzyme
MIKAQGLHLALPVKDMERTLEFYSSLFHMEVLYRTMYHDSQFVMMGWGEHRISFLERPANIPEPPWVSRSGENPLHLGFRVNTPEEVVEAAEEFRRRGVQIIIGPRERNEVNERAVYCLDPNGYQVEVYCEHAHSE